MAFTRDYFRFKELASRYRIESIKFGVLSPQLIRSMSVVEITNDIPRDEVGSPVPGSVLDPRLGSPEPGSYCPVCGNDRDNCPGHFGHIDLAFPVINVLFTDYIYNILRGVCINCGRIKISEDELELLRKRAILFKKNLPEFYGALVKSIIKKAYESQRCPHCGMENVKIMFEKPYKFYKDIDGEKIELMPSEIREIFERIPDSDLILYGLDKESVRPEWFILTVLPVPPLNVRPSILHEGGEKREDDLTHKLVDIVKVNNKIKKDKAAGSVAMALKNDYDVLQLHVVTYYNNELPGIPPATHRGVKRLKALVQRLSGKEGRFRNNLIGKRVNFSARTVISPDSNLDINEVGVPIDMAKILTVPVSVTPYNIEFLRELVRRGADDYPGANYIIKMRNGRLVKHSLKYVVDKSLLADNLEVGDIVERHLMDGDIVLFNRQPSLHRMSIMGHKAKILPYRTFRLHLTVCPPYNADFDGDEMNLHVPQNSEASAEALSLMLVENQIISPRYGAPIIGFTKDYLTSSFLLTRDERKLDKHLFFNLLSIYDEIPKMDLVKKGGHLGHILFSILIPDTFTYSLKSRLDEDVIIKRGILVKGVIDKKSIGAEQADSILHRLVREYGNRYGGKFITNFSRILDRYLQARGFSIGIEDLKLPDKILNEIREIVREASKNVDKVIEDYRKGRLELIKGLSAEESLEQRIHEILAEARTLAGLKALDSLDKDNPLYVMVMSGARGTDINVAQLTAMLGQQTIRGERISRGYRNRTLSTFKEGDIGAKARGFIESNFYMGLNPVEFFFHAMSGREGLMDTAVKTQQSGYLYRRLLYSLEHLQVDNDFTIRTAYGKIIQFVYGDDMVDPSRSDHGKPVNVERLVDSISLLYPARKYAGAKYIDSLLEKVKDEIPKSLYEELRETLIRKKANRDVVRESIRQAVINYRTAMIDPNTAIGVITAQSIGEPGTQMTLRTFHYAGVKEKNVTIGLPRIIEIVDAKQKPSTPRMTIYLDENHRYSQELAEKIANRIKSTKLRDLVKSARIDLMSRRVVFELDMDALERAGLTPKDVKRVFSRRYSTELNGNLLAVKPSLKTKDGEIQDMSLILTRLRRAVERFLDKHITGIQGIVRVTVDKVVNEETGEEEWVLYTAGSNLREVLTFEGVDPTRTVTNDIFEIVDVLGIEAARNAIIEEIKAVLDEQGLDVDIRHVMLVADMMTRDGAIKQMGRYGVVATKESVLAKAAFETTVPVLVKASVRGETDYLKGPTENIIVGSRVPIGTGSVDVYIRVGG